MGRVVNLLCSVDQVQVTHQFGNTSYHLTGQTSGYPFDHVSGGLCIEDPLAELCNGPAFDAVVDRFVDSILDNSCYFILFVWNGRILS